MRLECSCRAYLVGVQITCELQVWPTLVALPPQVASPSHALGFMKMATEDESEFAPDSEVEPGSESEDEPASESEGEPTSETEGEATSESEGGPASDNEGGPASESERSTSSSASEGAGKRECTCASPTAALTDYEASRLANIERNKKKLEELGLEEFNKKKLEQSRDVIVKARRTPKRSVRFEDEPQEEEVTRITRSRSAASPTSRINPRERKVRFAIKL